MSSPGRGCIWIWARLAVSVTRGSMTISFACAFSMSLSMRPGFCPGKPGDLLMTGLMPTSSQASAVSNCGWPACHMP
nr:hypothetical protein [Sphingobium fuliginis]